jgi:hypothetical protein
VAENSKESQSRSLLTLSSAAAQSARPSSVSLVVSLILPMAVLSICMSAFAVNSFGTSKGTEVAPYTLLRFYRLLFSARSLARFTSCARLSKIGPKSGCVRSSWTTQSSSLAAVIPPSEIRG